MSDPRSSSRTSGSSGSSGSRASGPRITVLIAGWVVTAALASPVFGIYYELRAAFYLLPPLALVYVYCQAHRRRATALLALIATLGVGLAIGLAALIPKATTALAP